ncbi:hypothetical protein L3Q82_021024 [Scortum barcoo]|uniref:Uncharacterized protein n=1 Tax=Scortum barcoo TaxID=214431 RepID=A0ACB8X313_9TELE|nr:hypothetical protein L3Q82_021024 [Scortum barcoo]
MGVCAGLCGPLLVCLTLLVSPPPALTAWDADLELLDLVEEIPQTFYHFLSVNQTCTPGVSSVTPAGPQLVAIYEVLKDEERRRKYDDILVNGLPDWRQPVFYYRRVRKMSNAELAFLLFLILTVGHYAVIWSIYLEKQLDELLSKKKKEKKKKLSSRPAEDLRCIGQDRADRVQDRPHWQDILPLKLSIWLYLSIKNLPQTVQVVGKQFSPGLWLMWLLVLVLIVVVVSVFQEVKQYYEDYQQMKQQQREEAEAAEQEVAPKEKRPKVKKQKVEFPVYEPPSENLNYQSYDQTTSIEEIEDQMDDWLLDRRAGKKKAADWMEDELSHLSRLMVKFPGGTPGRWEKIAQELGRSVTDVSLFKLGIRSFVCDGQGRIESPDWAAHITRMTCNDGITCPCVTTKVKQVKENVSHSSGLVKLSELKGTLLPVRSLPVSDNVMTQRGGRVCEEEQEEEEDEAPAAVRKRNRKSATADGGEMKVRGRRQRDFDPTTALEEEEEEPQENREKADTVIWTQNQQKLLELALQQFPRGTTERWDRIAKVVPGKTKVRSETGTATGSLRGVCAHDLFK